ncbi:MAG: hypothetical protein ISS10_00325 [Candidatus Marinimicrobia bacterium]|nr:hypothetical protein [Candidatus Neomarinimicrobiota bacterium]MBL7059425.1 hypothetical protein [Candidatus Neomarinimicrobiota bacterium]
MRRILITVILTAFFIQIGISQTKRDARSVALSGAYTTIADGVYAVGYNPALLAYQREKPFMLQLGGIDFGLLNNWASLANLSNLSGDTLYADEKDDLYSNFSNKGLTFFQDIHIPLPGLNYTSGNMAFTTNLLLMSNIQIPPGVMKLLLYGNANIPNLDVTMHYEILGVNELGFSFAIPFNRFAFGMTVKYLQGLYYFGADPDSSYSNLVNTGDSVYGQGTYYLRQGIGGTGIGLDIGFATQDLDGWRFGVSIINAIGSIDWNKPSLTKDILAGKDNIYGNDDDLWHFSWSGTTLNDSMAILYTYEIDSLNATSLSGETLFTSEQRIVKNIDKNGKVKTFTTNYPALFRLGLSYQRNNLLIASDLVAGFEDRFYARQAWKWSIGLEFTKFPTTPLRVGFGWGGADLTELSMGFGIHKGPVIFDFGVGFRNGLWIHTMKGINVSASVAVTSFKSRKNESNGEPERVAPAPEPISLPDAEQQ